MPCLLIHFFIFGFLFCENKILLLFLPNRLLNPARWYFFNIFMQRSTQVAGNLHHVRRFQAYSDNRLCVKKAFILKPKFESNE